MTRGTATRGMPSAPQPPSSPELGLASIAFVSLCGPPAAIVLCVFKRRICFRGYWLFSLARRMRFWRQFLRGSPRQPWRKRTRHLADCCDWFAFLFHHSTHRKSVVRCRLPRGGLG